MSGVEQRFPVTEFLCRSVVLLWLVDQSGKLILCVEERVDVSDSERRIPNSPELEYGVSWQKLGHPSLVAGSEARIAGELYFDDSLDEPAWVLTNKSGRYGLKRLGRKAEQLDNVADEFSTYAINVRAYMID